MRSCAVVFSRAFPIRERSKAQGLHLDHVHCASRGASCKESLEQSVETRFFVAGTPVMRKGLSTVQCPKLGRILPWCAAATQDSIPVALINGKKLSVKPTNLKVEDNARPDGSMLPLPQATDDPRSDESWPLWDNMGIKPVGAIVDEDAVPENPMPSLEADGNKTPAIPKLENPGAGGRTSTFNKLLAAGDGSGALEDVGKETLTQSAETQLRRGHQSDSQMSDRTAVQRCRLARF